MQDGVSWNKKHTFQLRQPTKKTLGEAEGQSSDGFSAATKSKDNRTPAFHSPAQEARGQQPSVPAGVSAFLAAPQHGTGKQAPELSQEGYISCSGSKLFRATTVKNMPPWPASGCQQLFAILACRHFCSGFWGRMTGPRRRGRCGFAYFLRLCS